MSNPEEMLISAILNSGDHITASSNGITNKFFHSYPDEFRWIETYISKHRRAPSKSAFKSKWPKFRIAKSADDLAFFCDEVRTSHATAELSTTVTSVLSDMQDGDIKRALATMHANSLKIESAMIGESNDPDVISDYQDVLDEVMRRMARRADMGQAGIPTGFPTLDERTGGPQPGHVWIWAARLGQGKTWSLVRTAAAAVFSGCNVQYDALEGSRPEIAMRFHTFASSEYGREVFKNSDLAMGQNFSPRAYKEFLHSLRNDVKGKMHIADTSKGLISPLSIAAQIERNHPDAVFLDYITLMDTADASGDDWKSIGRLSASLKQIAQQYQIPIIAAAQLNRQAAIGRDLSGPENLAESDAIGRDADAVITMRQLSKHIIAFKLAKYRHGRDGYMWYTKFLPNTGHFEEITFDEAQDVIADDKDAEVDDDFTFSPRKKGSFKAASDHRHKIVKSKSKNASSASKTASTKKRVVRRSR